jgi:hypothetical protein
MTVLIRNVDNDYNETNSIVTEQVYQGDTTSVHNFTVIAGDTGISGVTFTPYAFDSSDIDPTFTPASTDSYQYITLSDDNNNFQTSLTENFTPLEEKVIYLKATIPSDAKIGTWECGLNECYDDETSNQPITGFEDWKHYAILPITGGNEEVENWLVELTLTYLEGAMSYYFHDVRFALSDGTELDYQITTLTEGEEATFKIELPTVPASPTVTNIYVLFGNESITEVNSIELGDNPEGTIYRKGIELTGSTDGAKTDFQRKLIVNHVSGKMRSDFGDVRFYESDGVTEIPYDLATCVEGDTAVFILFFDTIPASPDTLSIYMQYGSGETTTSSPEDVYDYYDDLSSDNWNNAGGASHNIANNQITVSGTEGIVYHDFTPTGDYIWRFEQVSVSSGSLWFEAVLNNNTAIKSGYLHISNDPYYGDGSNWNLIQDSSPISRGNGNVEYQKVGNNYKIFVDEVEADSFTHSTLTSGHIGFRTENNVTWIYSTTKIYKTTANPPTWGSWGEEEGIGLPSTGSLGSTQLNGHLYEKDLTIWGKVLSQTPEAPIGNEELVVINVSGNTSIGGMTDFNITKRANDKATGFQFNYRTGTDGVFASGDEITLVANGPGYDRKYLNGIIEEVDHNLIPANKTYSITGRDKAAALMEQDFYKNGLVVGGGSVGGSTYWAFVGTFGRTNTILEEILQDTEIILGPTAGIGSMMFVNYCNVPNLYSGTWFFGYFKTKKAAIDYLCVQAGRRTGKTYRWFVDSDGVLNIYAVDDVNTQSSITINEDNPRLVSANFKDSITNIINKQTGYYGENEANSITKQDDESIALYGLHQDEDLHDSSMSYSDMATELQNNIDRLAWPVYTIELTLKRFIDIEEGQPLYTNIDPGQGVLFIVSDVTITGTQAKDIAVISATTDSSVFSEEEEVEIIKAVAQKTVDDNSASVGTVSSVSSSGVVNVVSWGNNGSAIAKDINS